MKDNQIHFFSEVELTKYYRSHDVSETMPLIEAECLDLPIATTKRHQRGDRTILFGLGLIATLLLFSGIQLHRSLKLTPAQPNNTNFPKMFTLNTKMFATAIPIRELKIRQTERKIDFLTNEIEILTIKKAIAQGKF